MYYQLVKDLTASQSKRKTDTAKSLRYFISLRLELMFFTYDPPLSHNPYFIFRRGEVAPSLPEGQLTIFPN